MPNLLVRDVTERVVELLKQRAARHHTSLQREMQEILEHAAHEPAGTTAAEVAETRRWRMVQRGVSFPDSSPLIRADRER